MTDAVDFGLALQTWMFDALSAGVTLAAVGQHITQDSRPPYVVIVQGGVEDHGSKDAPFERHTPKILTVFEGLGSKQVRLIQAEVRAALDFTTPQAAGCDFSPLKWTGTDPDELMPDGVTYASTQNFEIWVQSAD